MFIAHASDTHDRPELITSIGDVTCDIILLTGDILNNRGRINGEGIQAPLEYKYQERWSRRQAKRWVPAFKGRDVIIVPGNHDFYNVERALLRYGHPKDNLHLITETNPCLTVQDVRFAGFRQIPWIAGEWMGEVHDTAAHVERAMSCDPEILVTHAPPGGILDKTNDGTGYGIPSLTTWLSYRPHSVRAHFFGHAHMQGGQDTEEMGIRFFNGACHMKVHEV